MMKIFNTSLFMILLISIFACNSNSSNADSVEAVDGQHKASVKEVLQANAYTYLLVEESSDKFWIACTKQDFSVGQTVYFTEGLAMENFESKDLNKTFDLVYFINQISFEPIPLTQPDMTAPHGMVKEAVKKAVQVEKAEGGITLGDLFANPEKYKGQTVTIRGEVVKYNEAIMGKNWIHIQDGTGNENAFDLTITTSAEVKVGDIVTFKGTINLNKDFGAGYVYEVIMEEAELQNSI